MSHATLPVSILTKHQVKIYGPKIYTEGGETYKLTATVRYDDQCGNGHNSFGITGAQYRKRRNGTWEEDSFGCMHETIVKHFPELAPYIKWHLCSSDGPMHYIANTLYQASDTDCWGLRKGEKRQLKHGGEIPVWEAVVEDAKGIFHALSTHTFPWVHAHEKPANNGSIQYVPHMVVGEGKEPNLEHARSSAIWPEATLEQLQDERALKDRLPQLLAEFKEAVESLGFTF